MLMPQENKSQQKKPRIDPTVNYRLPSTNLYAVFGQFVIEKMLTETSTLLLLRIFLRYTYFVLICSVMVA